MVLEEEIKANECLLNLVMLTLLLSKRPKLVTNFGLSECNRVMEQSGYTDWSAFELFTDTIRNHFSFCVL